jgi:CubicO group peptidase (beta-lactamase class C family)
VTAIAVASLAQRGLLDYSARIAYYWPEFAQHQKGEIRQYGRHIALDLSTFIGDHRDSST